MPHLSGLAPADRQRLAEALIKNPKEDPKAAIAEIVAKQKQKASPRKGKPVT